MPKPVCRGNGDQSSHEIRRNRLCLRARSVQPHHKEANRDMERFPRHLVLVDKCSPLPMNGDEAERAGTAAKVPPGPT